MKLLKHSLMNERIDSDPLLAESWGHRSNDSNHRMVDVGAAHTLSHPTQATSFFLARKKPERRPWIISIWT